MSQRVVDGFAEGWRMGVLVVGCALLGGLAVQAQGPGLHVVSNRVDPCLRLRAEPGLAGVTLDCVSPGTQLDIVEVRGGWVRGRLANGREGWAASRFLEAVAEPDAARLQELEKRLERMGAEKSELEEERARLEAALAAARQELERARASASEALQSARDAGARRAEAEAATASRAGELAMLQQELDRHKERVSELELAHGTAEKSDEERVLLESELEDVERLLREMQERAARAESRLEQFAAGREPTAVAQPAMGPEGARRDAPDRQVPGRQAAEVSEIAEAAGSDSEGPLQVEDPDREKPNAVPLGAGPPGSETELELVPLEPLVETVGDVLPGAEVTALEPPTPAEPVVDRRAAAEAEIRTAVEIWALAWASQDVERYLASYAVSFAPADGSERAAWEALRRERLAQPAFIEVSLDDLVVQVGEPAGRPTRAEATFRQTYASDTFSDVVMKRLVLVLEEGVWRIASEEASS